MVCLPLRSKARTCRVPLILGLFTFISVTLFFLLLPASFPLALESRVSWVAAVSAGSIATHDASASQESQSAVDSKDNKPGQTPEEPRSETLVRRAKASSVKTSASASVGDSVNSSSGRSAPDSAKLSAAADGEPFWGESDSGAAPCNRTLRFSKALLPVTALASVQGSGNTWMRHLVQRLTGIYTGSVYGRMGDPELWARGYFGEGIHNGSVVVVKTHGLPEKRFRFQRAVLLIRNPYDAMFADFNRRASGSHTGIAPARAYLKHWDSFSKVFIDRWARFHISWLSFRGPLLLLIFDDLVNDLPAQLDRMALFLKHPSLALNVTCAESDPGGQSKRGVSSSQQQQHQQQQQRRQQQDERPGTPAAFTFSKDEALFRELIQRTNGAIKTVQSAVRRHYPSAWQTLASWKRPEKEAKDLVWKSLPGSII